MQMRCNQYNRCFHSSTIPWIEQITRMKTRKFNKNANRFICLVSDKYPYQYLPERIVCVQFA